MTAPSRSAGRVVVDPRFRARRIAVRKQAGRRRLKRLLALIAVAMAALTAVIVLKSPILDVDEIVIEGATRTDAALVTEAAGIANGEPLLLADLGRAETAVEALPWVAEASVRREIPGGIHVEIVERVPVATLAAGGVTLLVDATGTVVAEAASVGPIFPPYVAVRSDDAAPVPGAKVSAELLTAVELASRLRENPPASVIAVDLSPSARLDLVGGGTAEFGDLVDIDAKVEAFRTMWARVDRTCLDTIDLRVPTHPVLTRLDSCS